MSDSQPPLHDVGWFSLDSFFNIESNIIIIHCHSRPDSVKDVESGHLGWEIPSYLDMKKGAKFI